MRPRAAHSIVLVALSVPVTLGGCEGDGQSTGADPYQAGNPPVLSKADGAQETEADALARQAERDVQAFLDRRDRAASDDQVSPSAPEMTPGPDPRRVVMFDDPPGTRVAAADATPIVQPPLFTEEQETLRTDTPAELAGAPLDEDRLDQLLIDVRRALYRRSAYSDMPLREMLFVAAMSIVSDDPVLAEHAVDALNDLSEDEKALLVQLQAFFHELGTKLDGGTPAETVVADAMKALKRGLDERHLGLGTTALCTRVVGFGNIVELGRNDDDRYAFLAHEETQLIVYLEVDDFQSELNDNDEWVTQLAQQLTIYSDADGIPVWKADWQAAVDKSTNRRRDFFTVQVITLPKALSVGRYHLKIRLRDEASGAEAEGGIEFEMVADQGMVP